jgi:hypothetical protein
VGIMFSMTSKLGHTLVRLEEMLGSHGWPVVDGLQPGLPEALIREELNAVGINPPDDAIELFSWHNGYLPPSSTGWQEGILTPVWSVMDLSAAMEARRTIAEAYERPYVAESFEILGRRGDAPWFPVLDGEVWWIVMNCGDDPVTRGMVTTWNVQTGIEASYYPHTLAEPVQWWIDLIYSGQYVFDTPSTQHPIRVTSLVTKASVSEEMWASGLV